MTETAFLDVDGIVGALIVAPGHHVADLGCGSGFFTLALAKAVGPQGMVTAVDVMAESLESVAGRAQAQGLANVTTVRADLEVLGGTKLPDASQDLALIKNVLFQSTKQDAIIHEAARILKNGGRLVVIDWKKGAGGFGPPDNLRPDEDQVRRMTEQAGLHPDRQLPVGTAHFGWIFVKQP